MERPGSSARCQVQEQPAALCEWTRACTAWELLETKLCYQKQLGLVAAHFVGILRAKGSVQPSERQVLCGPWEPLKGTSQELLLSLEGGHLGTGAGRLLSPPGALQMSSSIPHVTFSFVDCFLPSAEAFYFDFVSVV